MAAYYARDYRDALTRLARFKQLCSPEELQVKVSKDECAIEPVWLHAQEETPPLLTDAAFVSFVELGRRGTGPRFAELRTDKALNVLLGRFSNGTVAFVWNRVCRTSSPVIECV
jgi:hypothetical protein